MRALIALGKVLLGVPESDRATVPIRVRPATKHQGKIEMLLAELFLLSALDPLHGTVRPNRAMSHQPSFLATALLMELAVCRELKRSAGGLMLDHDLPSFHILVDQARAALKRSQRALPPAEAVDLTRHELPNLRENMLEGLAERGILHAGGRRRYWLFGPRRYPLRSKQASDECVQLLEKTASGKDNSLRANAAAILATGSGLATIMLHASESNQLHERVKRLRLEQQGQPDKEHAADAEAIGVMLMLGTQLTVS